MITLDLRPFVCRGLIAAIKAADGRTLPTFSGNAYTGVPMRPDGWSNLDLIIDLDGVTVPSQHRPALHQHDHEQIVGHTTSVKVNRKGIQVSGIFSGQREQTDKVTIPAKNGFQWQLSVGANPTAMRFLEHGEEGTVNGQPLKGPLAISAETRLEEVSFVALGADQGTHVVVAAKRKEQLVMASTATQEGIARDELRRGRALKRLCAAAGHPVINFRHPSGRVTREALEVVALRCGWRATDVQDIIRRAGRPIPGACLGTFWDTE